MKTYKLLKPLPYCPVGRIFKENTAGHYYLSMTDDEASKDELIDYRFSKYRVESSPVFFEEVIEIPDSDRIYQLKRKISRAQRRINYFNEIATKAQDELNGLENWPSDCCTPAQAPSSGAPRIRPTAVRRVAPDGLRSEDLGSEGLESNGLGSEDPSLRLSGPSIVSLLLTDQDRPGNHP